MPAARTTDLNIAQHRRLVYRTIIEALRAAFDGYYNRDRQFTNLKITQEYPYEKVDYPAIVVEYQNTLVANAGVGHREWFHDQDGNLRVWNHNRFEGTLYFTCYALSTLDRDTLADALVELVRFGKLDSQLQRFFNIIRPSGDEFVALQQIIFDSDQLRGSGDSATIAPWQPEDMLIYSAAYTVAIGGGYYNTVVKHDWSKVTHIQIEADLEDEQGHLEPKNVDIVDVTWKGLDYFDQSTVTGVGHITAAEGGPFIYLDKATVKGAGEPSGTDLL